MNKKAIETQDEIKIPVAKDQYLCFQSSLANEQGTEYVRFEDKNGREILYYDKEEWAQDPEEVMGAIMSCILNGADKLPQAKKGVR